VGRISNGSFFAVETPFLRSVLGSSGLEKQRFCEEIQVRIEIRRLGCRPSVKTKFCPDLEPAGPARSVADALRGRVAASLESFSGLNLSW
jgi:hypothetical protein